MRTVNDRPYGFYRREYVTTRKPPWQKYVILSEHRKMPPPNQEGAFGCVKNTGADINIRYRTGAADDPRTSRHK